MGISSLHPGLNSSRAAQHYYFYHSILGHWSLERSIHKLGRAGCRLPSPGGEYFLLYPALKQFRLGGSSAVREETPGLSRIRSKAVFQDLLSRLVPQGPAVGKRRRGIDYGWGWGSGEKGRGRAVEVSLRNKPKVSLFLLFLICMF